MKDVAERCGVAESTISHVVNQTRFVSPETRRQVLQAMRELNYHANAHARRLARGRSDFVGLIISDIENPFFPGLIKGFESAALEHGFDLLLCTTNYDPERTRGAFRKMVENKVPGVAVMTSRVDRSLADVLITNRIPSVFLDAEPARVFKSNIRMNYAKGACQAIAYLYNLGHRNFYLIAGPQNRPSHHALRNAVEHALYERGIPYRGAEGENREESGAILAHSLLSEGSFPSAILCSNDLTAIGLMNELANAGLRVPDDVSVVGADDIRFARLTCPPLTTIRIPKEELGRLAFSILEEMIPRSRPAGTDRTIDTELIIRGSTGPPGEAAANLTVGKGVWVRSSARGVQPLAQHVPSKTDGNA
jgi:LacI family transcriptional regulator